MLSAPPKQQIDESKVQEEACPEQQAKEVRDQSEDLSFVSASPI